MSQSKNSLSVNCCARDRLKMTNKLKWCFGFIATTISFASFAMDTYNPTNNQLTIPQVIVESSLYTDVVVTVREVLSVDGVSSGANTDVYTANNNVLKIPSVLVNGAIYKNVSITVGSVINVGDSMPTSAASLQAQVQTDIKKNSLSDFYTSKLLSTYDDSCLTQASIVQYPAEYIGQGERPNISDLENKTKSLSQIAFGVVIKDNWGGDYISNPNINFGCSTNNRTAFVKTLERVKSLNAKYVTIANYSCLDDVNNPEKNWWTNKNTSISIADLKWMSEQAKKSGVKLRLYFQACLYDPTGNIGLNPPEEWLNRMINGYESWVLDQASALEGSEFEGMSIDWGDWNPDWSKYLSIRNARLTDLAKKIRKVYSGKIFHQYMWIDTSKTPDLINNIDYFEIFLSGTGLSNSKQPTFADLKNGYSQSIKYYSTFSNGKPLSFRIQIQSHSKFYEIGWIEDSGCWKNYKVDMVCFTDPGIQTDFNIQALGYHAALSAIYDLKTENIESVNSAGYWWADTLKAKDSFPNGSQSIRNKPAEYVLYKWFAK